MKKFNVFLSGLLLTGTIFFAFNLSTAEAAYSENLVPVMTSNNSNGAIASADSEYLGNAAWYAFDNDPSTYWVANNYEGWLSIELPSPKVVTKYSFWSREAWEPPFSVVPPTIFKLQAYNETTSSWITLSENSEGDWLPYGERLYVEYEFNNTHAYKKYRLITNGTLPGYDYDHLNLDSFQLYETLPSVITANSTSIAYSHGFDFITAKRVSKLLFNLNNTTSTSVPTVCKIEGYNETSGQWENVNYTGTIAFGSNQLIVDNTKAYKQYRLNLSFSQSSAVNLTGLTIYGTD